MLKRALIAPVDTGIWVMGCNRTLASTHHWPVVCNSPELAGWGTTGARPLASFQDFDHLMLANAGFWNASTSTWVPGPTFRRWRAAAELGPPPPTLARPGAPPPSFRPAAAAAGRNQIVNLARLFARLVADAPYNASLPLTSAEATSMCAGSATLCPAVALAARAVLAVAQKMTAAARPISDCPLSPPHAHTNVAERARERSLQQEMSPCFILPLRNGSDATCVSK